MGRISYSQLSMFSECPKRWKLKYIDDLAIQEPSIHFGGGSQSPELEPRCDQIDVILLLLYYYSQTLIEKVKYFNVSEVQSVIELFNYIEELERSGHIK